MPQQVKGGYLLLMQTLFRPILIIAGFILAMLLMDGLYDFLNLVWQPLILGANGVVGVNGAVNTNTTASSLNAFSLIIYGIIYGGIVYSIINNCMKAVDYVPNQVLRWIGSSGDQHRSDDHGHVTAAAAAGGQASQQLGSTLGNLGAKYGENRKALNRAEESGYRSELGRQRGLKEMTSGSDGAMPGGDTGVKPGITSGGGEAAS
jgi:hypothetical protein